MYSKEEIEQANNVGIIEYINSNNIPIKKVGRDSYSLIEHDSLKITPSVNKWYWHSRRIGGVGGLSFVMKYEGKDFKNAMQNVLCQSGSSDLSFQYTESVKNQVLFKLPQSCGRVAIAMNYLIDVRCIERKFVEELFVDGKLYADINHNCVFIGYDKTDKERYALKIGTNPYKSFKGEVYGSNKAFSMEIYHDYVNAIVKVFESPIDALSYQTLKSKNNEYTTDSNLISLGGVSDKKLEKYLKDNVNITKIVCCLDNDKAGINAGLAILKKYAVLGYEVEFEYSKVKDWNDDLIKSDCRND